MQHEFFPREVTSNVPRITLTGHERLHVEQHRGLIAYQPDEIVFAVNPFTALVAGLLGLPGIALKAVLTPSNAEWDSVKLHDELMKEHLRMHGGKK